jgi:hypothetical protein
MIRILGLAVALSVLPLTNALAEPSPQPQAPGARTDAQLVALFDYWMTEQAAGRMSRDQARAQAQSLSPEEQQRLRAAVTARDEAALAESEEQARRSAEEARRAQEELRRAHEAARRALGGPRS